MTKIDGRTLIAMGVTLVFWSSAFAGIRAALKTYTPTHLVVLQYAKRGYWNTNEREDTNS